MSWDRIATEGQTVSVAAGTAVRYGVSAADRFVERVVSGPVTANNATFGDPAVRAQVIAQSQALRPLIERSRLATASPLPPVVAVLGTHFA